MADPYSDQIKSRTWCVYRLFASGCGRRGGRRPRCGARVVAADELPRRAGAWCDPVECGCRGLAAWGAFRVPCPPTIPRPVEWVGCLRESDARRSREPRSWALRSRECSRGASSRSPACSAKRGWSFFTGIARRISFSIARRFGTSSRSQKRYGNARWRRRGRSGQCDARRFPARASDHNSPRA